VQLGQRIHRCTRRAKFHVSASHDVEHPGSDHDDGAWFNLDVHDLAVGAPLAVFAPDAASMQRVPAVEDFDFLPDMGRMTR
jgi:hypothetical protein